MSFVVSVPPPEHVPEQPYRSKNYYIINTFITQTASHTDIAIDYYYDKYLMFIKQLAAQADQQFSSASVAVPSIWQMFEQAYSRYTTNGAPLWRALQSQSTANLRQLASKLNAETQKLVASGQTYIDFQNVLNIMTNTSISSNKLPGTININSINGRLSSFLGSSTLTTRQAGSHRANLFGEIFEQGVGTMFADSFQGLLGYLQVGRENSWLPNNTVAQGKTDSMFFVDVQTDGGLQQHGQSTYQFRGKYPNYTTTQQHNIELEASQLFDLSQKGDALARSKYISDSLRGGMMGVSVKSWIGQTGSFGSFSTSASEINARRPNGISTYFEDQETFNDYNAYVVSKYLINIIGAYNAILATGDEIMPTYRWLASLYSGERLRRIRHSTMKAAKESASGSGKHFYVSNRLSVSYV